MVGFRPVRGLGAAKSGTWHFIFQRVTGVVNALFLLFVVVMLSRALGYQHLIYTLSNPLVLSLVIVGICSTTVHMVLGMRVIIEDYVHRHTLKNVLLVGNLLLGVLLVVMAIISVIRLGLIA